MEIKYEEVEEKYREKLDKLFGVENCLIEVNPGKILIPPKFKELGERILNLEVRPDDVWLISYPRTGSTWVQEMVWCLTNNLDYEGAKLLSQMRAPLLELTALFGNDEREWKNMLTNSVEQVENMPSPRCIKTHLPWDLLPTQLNVVKPKTYLVKDASTHGLASSSSGSTFGHVFLVVLCWVLLEGQAYYYILPPTIFDLLERS